MSTAVAQWDDSVDELPPPEVINLNDTTKLIVSYKYNQKNEKVKVSQKIRMTKITEKVPPSVLERRNWKKYGKERNTPPGPTIDTTQIADEVILMLSSNLKELMREEELKKKEAKKEISTGFVCRLCGGAHMSSKCPYKDLFPESDSSAHDNSTMNKDAVKTVGAGGYVPPHMRNGGGSGRREYDDEEEGTTLKISSLNPDVTEDDLREELLAPYFMKRLIKKLFLVKDRETGRSRGFAYVQFCDTRVAEHAKEKLNGTGFHSMVLSVDVSKRRRND